MSKQIKTPNESCAKRSSAEKAFSWDVITLAEDILDAEVQKLVFNGGNYSPVLVSQRNPAVQLGRMGVEIQAC
ncbi:MAG TPA: hypothetical protein VN578_22590 [Candidatus Binatia bacterium]|jgi:hypothetical protein|nr:hypothetical protein [Candidatus Binatia bacterium]